MVTYTNKIKNDVAPTLRNVLKASLNAVFTGVPRVIKQVTLDFSLNGLVHYVTKEEQ